MPSLIGRTLNNRYFLRKLVGSGGSADVYEAWDRVRNTEMAIKVLRHDLALNPRFFQQFAKEAVYLQNLQHPNIVRLYGFEKDSVNHIVFIVLDWVAGSNLRTKLVAKKRPMSLDEIGRILQPVCSALNYAHKLGVYHCDVKPPNILVDNTGEVLLTDFGVARLTGDTVVGGTAPYMAPEQFTGDPVSERTDVYGLGITLFEMLSGGQAPFRGVTSNSQGSTQFDRIAWEHLNQPVPSILPYNPELSSSIVTLLETALRKDPAERYADTITLFSAFDSARTMKSNQDEGVTVRVSTADIEKWISTSNEAQRPGWDSQSTIKGPYLYGQRGQMARNVVRISGRVLTVGRANNQNLRLRDLSVSRRHAVIIFERNGVYIQDLESTQGTVVNNNRITGVVRLHNGDIIQFGAYDIFEFREK